MKKGWKEIKTNQEKIDDLIVAQAILFSVDILLLVITIFLITQL